jgi:uncharacterized protein
MSGTDKSVPPPAANATDRKVLELLVCPLTKTQLVYDAKAQELISRAAGLAYPIRNGVPLMIEDAARKLNDADFKGLRAADAAVNHKG